VKNIVSNNAIHFGGVTIDMNKIKNELINRIQCIDVFDNMLKFVGDYNDADFIDIDSNFVMLIKNYFYVPTKNELSFVVDKCCNSLYSNDSLNVYELQNKIFDNIVNLLLNKEKIKRIVNNNVVGTIKNDKYDSEDIFVKSNYLSLDEYLHVIMFSPGCNVVDIGEINVLNIPKGMPWLYYTYLMYYKSNSKRKPWIPYSGIYDVDAMINPIYPMSSLSASAGTHMPTPHPIVGTGLFPEIPLFMTYVVEKKYGFVDEYFMIHLKHLSNLKKQKQLMFLNKLLLVINDQTNCPILLESVINVLKLIIESYTNNDNVNSLISYVKKVNSLLYDEINEHYMNVVNLCEKNETS
jgi:hypothetical protein